MQTSTRGKLEILSHEAVILNRYKDSKGVWTIGPGVTAAAKASVNPLTFRGVLNDRAALALLDEVLPKYEATVSRALNGRKVRQHEYDALVSLAWNCGDIAKPLTMGRIAKGDVAGAIDLWRADRILWKRRDMEVRLAREGVYSGKSVMFAMADPNGMILKSTRRFVPIAKLEGMMA